MLHNREKDCKAKIKSDEQKKSIRIIVQGERFRKREYFSRITSYNVCYTKLLRGAEPSADHIQPVGIPQGSFRNGYYGKYIAPVRLYFFSCCLPDSRYSGLAEYPAIIFMETPPPLVNLSQQRCFNHTSREAVARCPECGRFFCRECITEHDDRVLCAVCLGKKGKTGFIRNIRLSADMIVITSYSIHYTKLYEFIAATHRDLKRDVV